MCSALSGRVPRFTMGLELSLCACLVFQAGLAAAADWPQFRGPNRDGISQEKGLATHWPDGGPNLLWSVDGVGDGYAQPSIAGGIVYITGVREGKEFASAFDLKGKRKWQVEYGTAWTKSFPPSRSAPTVDGNSLYIISGAGEVVRVDAETGTLAWSVPAKETFGGKVHPWGTGEAALVVDDKVLYTPAGAQTTMVALNKATGELVWQTESLNDKASYLSPVLITHKGIRMIIGGTGNYIFAVAPEDGRMLWKYNYAAESMPKNGGSINCNSPIYHEGNLFITSGYNHVGLMLGLDDRGQPGKLWTNTDLDTHHGGVVLVDGYLYGSNWISNHQGNWVCVDWKTGRTVYEKTWETKGSIISAEGMLYCYEEKGGKVALVKASPDDFAIVSVFTITLGAQQHWCHPAISDGVLYIRHGDVLMAYDIRAN